jgi:plastocyanin
LAATANVNVGSGGNFFAPVNTNIAVSDRVIWHWVGNNHDVASTNGAWTTSPIQGIGTTFTNTFSASGTYFYFCTVHGTATSGMKGSVVVAAVNVSPTVTITNPVSGAVFAAPANVTLQAAASDTDGTVTNVQFRVGTIILTNDNAAPYAAVTNNLAAGSYTLFAIVSDNTGATGTNSISIIVDVPPSVTITNPASGTVFATPANVTLQASASDPDGTVTNVLFLVDGNVVTNDPVGPFSAVTNNLAAGSHSLAAVVSDNNGLKITNTAAISVVNPVTVLLNAPQPVPPGEFRFTYTANAGLNYIVQRATNLPATSWATLSTNTAGGSSINFTDANATLNRGFYRVGRLPNP